ncbi:MAG: hypothetical protein Kow0042_31730 [Calditrichia bacterium]
MKFKAKSLMKSNPDFEMDTHFSPLDFNVSVKGSLETTIDTIGGRIGEIPVKMTIPFLKRPGGPVLIGSIGGFNIKLNPFKLKLEQAEVKFDGILGTEGLKGNLKGKVGCQTEMDVSGHASGRVGTFNVKFEETEEES